MPVLPFGSWLPDIATLNGPNAQNIQNVMPRMDGFGPWKSLNSFAQPLAAGNDTNTKALLHFEGIDASTTFNDEAFGASAAHTWTARGNAQIDTAQFKLGFSSGLFDGTGDWIDTPDSSDFTITGDFTIDCWIRPAANGTDIYFGGHGIVALATRAWSLLRQGTNGNKIQAVVGNGSSQAGVNSTTAIVSGSWWHIALVRSGTTVTLYVNGVAEGTATFSGALLDASTALAVGAGDSSGTAPWNGWIDEFRLSVGTARWTAAFVPPGKPYDKATNNVPHGVIAARLTDGSVQIFASCAATVNSVSGSRLLQLRNTDLDWIDVSQSFYSAIPTGYHFPFIQFGNLVIAVQPNITPQAWTLGSSTKFADLGGSPPQAAYAAVVGQFVMLTGLTSAPTKAQWSGQGNATQWTDGTNFAGSQTFQEGGLTRGVAGGEYGILFQDTQIRRIIIQYGSAVPVQFEKVTNDMGLLAPYSIAHTGSDVFFLAQQGYFRMGPTGYPVPVGKGKFDDYILKNYDTSQLQLIMGASDPEGSRVYLAFKSQSGPAGSFDRIICYDWILDRATPCVAVNGQFISSFASPGLTLENLDTISSSIDALTFSLDDVPLTGSLPKVACFSAGVLSFFSGTPFEATIDTPEQELELGRRVRVRGFRPQTDATSVYGSVGTRENMQGSVVYTTEQAITTQGKCWANISTRLARGRIRIPAGTLWNFALGVEPEFTQEGKR